MCNLPHSPFSSGVVMSKIWDSLLLQPGPIQTSLIGKAWCHVRSCWVNEKPLKWLGFGGWLRSQHTLAQPVWHRPLCIGSCPECKNISLFNLYILMLKQKLLSLSLDEFTCWKTGKHNFIFTSGQQHEEFPFGAEYFLLFIDYRSREEKSSVFWSSYMAE